MFYSKSSEKVDPYLVGILREFSGTLLGLGSGELSGLGSSALSGLASVNIWAVVVEAP